MQSFKLKNDFPIFKKHPELVFLDSAASAQKPQSVLEVMDSFYKEKYANVHRGIYQLAEEATEAYETARQKVMKFINARSQQEIIYTRNATEAVNLLAYTWVRENLKAGDVILTSLMEHHANIVPWQILNQEINKTKKLGIKIEVVKLTEGYRLDLEDFKIKLNKFQPKLVALTQASNVLGTINPVKELIAFAHAAGAKVLIDGAQAVPHIAVDVQDLDTDFYVFSGHKMLGPTGSGVLYAKKELLEQMPPFMGGGDMIKRVTIERSEWNELPYKFEAGTPDMAAAVGLGAAIDYIHNLGYSNIEKHEQELTEYGLKKLSGIKGLNLYGPKSAEDRLGVFAFSLAGVHAHDVASLLDQDKIAVRAGHHCAMPLHTEVLRQPATARASLYIYNTKEDTDKLVESLEKIILRFKP